MSQSCDNMNSKTSAISGFGCRPTVHKIRQSSLVNSRSAQHGEFFQLVYTTVLTILLFTTVVTAVSEVESNFDLGDLRICTEDPVDHVISSIGLGLPYRIDCDPLLDHMYYEYVEFENETEYKCIVTSGIDEVIVYEANVTGASDYYYSVSGPSSDPFVIESTSAQHNGSLYTSYLIGGETCFKILHTLKITDESFEQQNCEDVVYKEGSATNYEVEEGEEHTLHCSALKSEFHLSSGILKWYKDCEEVSSKPFEEVIENVGDYIILDELQIVGNFSSAPGEYTCSITYNEREIFLSKSTVCVKHTQYSGPPAFIAISSDNTKVRVGDDVTLTCGGVTGTSSSLSFAIMWFRNCTNGTSPNICPFSGTSALEGSFFENGKHHCSLNSNILTASKCYSSNETTIAAGNQENGITMANMSLTIRNFVASDAGEYICRILTTHGPQVVRFTVEQEEEHIEILVIVLPTLAGILCLILVGLLLFICIRREKLKQQWKKSMKSKASKGAGQDQIKEGIDNYSLTTETHTKETELPRDVV